MEVFLTILRYAAGPVLGAVIGYFTNWLALKMLFRPYYPKTIGKWRLPFTPGIIPKRKPALAKAVGKAVGEQLFTKADFAAAFTSEAAKEKIAGYALSLWRSAGDKSVQSLVESALPREKAAAWKENAEAAVSDKIFAAVQKFDLGAVIAREGVKAVEEKKASLGMLGMFLSRELVTSLGEKLAAGVNAYVAANGRRLIAEGVKSELESAASSPLNAFTKNIDEQTVRKTALSLYEGAVQKAVAQLAESVDIAAVVEEKINAMDVKELEKLVLSVMKKELNAIVNLGALIGFILGVVMIFF